MKKALFAGLLSILIAAPVFAADTTTATATTKAAPCRDAKGHFAKCPPKSTATKTTHCRDAKGHFAKCGTAAGAATTASATPAAQ